MKALSAFLMTGLLGVALSFGCAVDPGLVDDGSGVGAGEVDENIDGQDADPNGAGDGNNGVGDGGQAGVTGIVAQWDFEVPGLIGFPSLAASTEADNVMASPFTSSDGQPTTTASPGVNWVTESGWTDAATFLSCTVEAAEGFEIRLDSLDFEQSTLDASGPESWRLRSSIDGFTADLATGSVLLFPNFGQHTVDLTGITVGSSPVEFRWFAVGATGEGVGWGVENVTVQGTVAPTGVG